MRLLINGQDGFRDEARDVLRAGLLSAAWITVDDTGARHKAANGFCTQIGNAHFAWFGTGVVPVRLEFVAFEIYGLLQIEWVKRDEFSPVDADFQGFYVNMTVSS